jgi:hypothetical protein
MFTAQINTLQERAAFIALLARRYGDVSGDLTAEPSVAGRHTIVRVRAGEVISHRAMSAVPAARNAETVGLDIAALAVAFAERLHDVDGVAFTHAQSEEYAGALQQHKPRSRRSLYYMTRAIFVTNEEQAATFNSVFSEVFGLPVGSDRHRERELTLTGARA